MENNNKELKRAIVVETLTEEEKAKELEKMYLSDEPVYYVPETSEDSSKKKYVILAYIQEDDGDIRKVFEIKKGRKNAYEYIKTIIEALDIHESRVLTGTVGYDNSVTVYDFMKYACEIFQEDEFDIEDYNN